MVEKSYEKSVLNEQALVEGRMRRDINLLIQAIHEILAVDIHNRAGGIDTTLGRKLLCHFALDKYRELSQAKLIRLTGMPIDRSAMTYYERTLKDLLCVDKYTIQIHSQVKLRWKQLQLGTGVRPIPYIEQKMLNSILEVLPSIGKDCLIVIASEIKKLLVKKNLRKDREEGQ